jgi:hypothetical protein
VIRIHSKYAISAEKPELNTKREMSPMLTPRSRGHLPTRVMHD